MEKEGNWASNWKSLKQMQALKTFFRCQQSMCAHVFGHLYISAGHLHSGLHRLLPSAALIRAIIKNCVNCCWGKHQPLSSLRTSIQFFVIPLNGERTGIINLLHPRDKSSVKVRDGPAKKQRMRASPFYFDQADQSCLFNAKAKGS